jgi:membrane peptidoglycan carboxypeptidase
MTRPPRQTFITRLTSLVPTKVKFSQLRLKPNAKVPEIWVQLPDSPKAEIYPLLGDRYRLGRSSQSCDIVIRSPLVSQTHASISRDDGDRWLLGLLPRRRFRLRDENSTNGIYQGKKRLKSQTLYHNQVYSLGPPDLADAIRIQYKEAPAPWLKAVRYGLYSAAGLTAVTAGAIAIAWQGFSISPMPNSVQGPVVVYARDGQTPVSPLPPNQSHVEHPSLSDYSPYLPKAVMASEDSRYYWHPGVDPIGTTRAIVANLAGGGIKEGGSSLTQQLARNLLRSYVGTEDSAARKIREALVALKLETTYSKDQLMLLYLNRVYLGFGNYGFEDASQFYFGKPARDLDLNEAATLAGILPAPNAFNPVRDNQSAVEYRNRVLTRMAQQGLVSSQEADTARRSLIKLSPKAQETLAGGLAPYYYAQVLDDLGKLMGDQVAQEGNFIVETGLDPRMQDRAEATLRDAINTTGSRIGFSQGAIASIDYRTGEILAIVGGFDFAQNQYNRASQARRQPGSTFKIFAYTAALEKGIAPATSYSCAPLNWDGQYFDGCGSGSLDFTSAIAQSANPVALRVAQDVGLNGVIQTARKMGVTADLKATPGLVLGQSEVSLLEMTSAFGILGNSGIKMPVRTIRRVWDSTTCSDRQDYTTCRLVYETDLKNGIPVLKPETAATMTQLLRGVVTSGTGKAAAIGQGEVGKTGTTNDGVDLWFIGYVPNREIATGVWLGNDDNQTTSGSSAQAAQVWGTYMGQALK